MRGTVRGREGGERAAERGGGGAEIAIPSQPTLSPKTHSLAAVRSAASDADLESTLGYQMEAVTRQLKDELDLIPRMREWAPWEVEAGATRELRIERPVVAGEKK